MDVVVVPVSWVTGECRVGDRMGGLLPQGAVRFLDWRRDRRPGYREALRGSGRVKNER